MSSATHPWPNFTTRRAAGLAQMLHPFCNHAFAAESPPYCSVVQAHASEPGTDQTECNLRAKPQGGICNVVFAPQAVPDCALTVCNPDLVRLSRQRSRILSRSWKRVVSFSDSDALGNFRLDLHRGPFSLQPAPAPLCVPASRSTAASLWDGAKWAYRVVILMSL